MLVFFDLPAVTKVEKKHYRQFSRFLKKEGYISLQESVYIKLLRHSSQHVPESAKLEKNSPPEGKITALPLKLDDMKKLVTILGPAFDMSFFSDDIIEF